MSTGYRPPSREPRGAWARHLHAARKERRWSQTRAFEEWGTGLGFGARSRSAYIAIDMGDRQPTPAEAAYLVSVVGEPTDTAPEPLERPESPDSLVQAIAAQTAAISELADQIRQERQARVEWERGLLGALRELAGTAEPIDGPEPAPRAGVRP